MELSVGAALSALFRHQRDFRFPMVLVKEGDLDIHAGTWHWVIGFARRGHGQVTVADEIVLGYEEEPNLIVISADEISVPVAGAVLRSRGGGPDGAAPRETGPASDGPCVQRDPRSDPHRSPRPLRAERRPFGAGG